jgi:outer membrane protein
MFGTPSIRILVFSLAVSVLAPLATAQTAAPATNAAAPASSPAAAGPAKIGIVNIQDAIVATNEGKKEFDGLQTKFAPKQNELKALNDEVENMKKDLQAKGDKLSDDARATQVKTLESKQKILQRNYEDAQNEFQQAEQEVVNRIGGKMLNVMEKYAKGHGYTVILDVSNPQTPVLYASEGTNITKELVDAYNAESPVAAPAPAKTSAAPAAPRPATPTATPKKP